MQDELDGQLLRDFTAARRPLADAQFSWTLIQRDDDTPEKVRKRLQDFKTLTEPLKAFYGKRGVLRPVNGVGSMDGIYQDIKVALGRG